jgi:DNA-binding MarR family transcriptional regulator
VDTTEILIKIRKIVRSINLESKKIQKQHGVSIPQVLCLNYLHGAESFQATQGEIRKFLNLNSSTVSGIINRLEKKGYVARLPKTGDKRVTNISLTSMGDKLLRNMPSLLHDQLSEKLNKLSDKKLVQIEDSLNTLVDILEIDQIEAYPVIAMDDYLEDAAGGYQADSPVE